MKLPIQSKTVDPENGLSFDFQADEKKQRQDKIEMKNGFKINFTSYLVNWRKKILLKRTLLNEITLNLFQD